MSNVGIGARRLAELPVRWVGELPRVLIMAGVAGGLDPALAVGDVVIQANADMIGLFGENLGKWPVGEGRIATVEEIVASPEEKSALRKRTGCAAVDMETGLAERFATERGIAFMAIRAISDRADQVLDPRVAKMVDADGRPRAGKVAAALIRRPGLMRDLSRLKKATDLACANLAAAVADAVERWREILADEEREK